MCPAHNIALPSVTTIISKTSSKKEIIKEWREWVGNKIADKTVEEAVALGSLVHTNVENYLMGIERPRGNHILRKTAYTMADQIIEYGIKPYVSEIYGIEVGLSYPGLYAGTTDLVGLFKNKLAIMDHKSAKEMRTIDQIDDYFKQLGAYALAHDEIYGTKIEMGVIFMVSRNNDFRIFEINLDQLEIEKENFITATEAYYATSTIPDISEYSVSHLG